MEIKKLWKVFIVLFLIIFVIFNWNEVSWIFNYRTVSGLLSGFFKRSDKEIQKNDFHNDFDYYEKESSLEIPKIGISAPLIFIESAEQKEGEEDKSSSSPLVATRVIEKSLDFGVVHFPDSVLPGQAGQTVILGHSAPSGWPRIKYDWVFTRLNELVEGDEIFVFFNNRKYEYIVTRKVFLEKGEEISQEHLTNEKNVLVLISCWPPGKDIRRIAVEAAIKK